VMPAIVQLGLCINRYAVDNLKQEECDYERYRTTFNGVRSLRGKVTDSTASRNPDFPIRSTKVPSLGAERKNSPFSSVIVSGKLERLVFSMRTETPGIGDPSESRTVPAILYSADC